MASPSDVVLASAVRTPIGKFGGAFRDLAAPELGAIALKESLERAGLSPSVVDEVVMGEVVQAGVGQNPARQAALKAGLPDSVSAFTINKVCGSSLKAVTLAYQAIRAGDASVVLAGGMESMSNAPYLVPRARFGLKYGNGEFIDALFHDGLRDAYQGVPMIETGEVVAQEFNISREMSDQFSVESHQKAARAHEQGHYKNEIVPVTVQLGRGKTNVVSVDEGIRADTSIETLGKLRSAFRKDGQVTAGNASQLSDGAAALIVASRAAAQEHGLDIMGRVVAHTTSGVEPIRVMAAPIPGVKKLLEKTGKRIEDVQLFEHNEAFASASCAVRQELGVESVCFNPQGGAVAMGHPIGASGARILTTLLHGMRRQQKDLGVATICLGGGNAVSVMVERE